MRVGPRPLQELKFRYSILGISYSSTLWKETLDVPRGRGHVPSGLSWHGAARLTCCAIVSSTIRISIPLMFTPACRGSVFLGGRFFSLSIAVILCAVVVDLVSWCFPLRLWSPCRGSVFVNRSFLFFQCVYVPLSWICRSMCFPCKGFGVPCRSSLVPMFRCRDGNLCICLPHAGEVLVSPLLPRFDQGLESRSKPAHCSSR